MAADHFCLRWNNYQSNMVTELDTLRSEEHLVDVTLSCEGQKFRAHKVILSACSVYFRNVFKENPCEHPVVILKDVSHEDVEALLSFVYQGVVYVSEKKLASFLQTAELLQIKGLTGAASTIKENHTAEKVMCPGSLAPSWGRQHQSSSKSSSSSSPTPPKRKKGTPVKIYKPSEGGAGGEGSEDTNSNNGDDDNEQQADHHHHSLVTVKQEAVEEEDDDDDNVVEGCTPTITPDQHHHPQVALGVGVVGMDEDGGGMECGGGGGPADGDSNSGSATFGDESSDVRRSEDESPATLLERSLSGCSRPPPPFDLQGPFSSFPIPAPGQGLPEQLTPADRLGRRPCPLCPKVISNKSNLLKHMRIRHSDEYNPAACVLCNKLFKNKYSLRAHFNIYHKSINAPPPQQQHPSANCTMPS